MGLSVTVEEITNRKPKNMRIQEGLETVLAARALQVHRTALKNSFLQELQNWSPKKKNQPDDTLDAVAGALKMSPVRIKRKLGSKKPEWRNGAKIRYAKTVLD